MNTETQRHRVLFFLCAPVLRQNKQQMMQQWKIIFAFLSMIGLGFVGGFFTHRYMARQTISKVKELSAAPGFQHHLLRRIEATPEQEEQLHPIVIKYGQQMAEVAKESRAKRRKIMDQMHEEIKPYLTKEQIDKLDEFSRRFRERKRRERDPEHKKRAPREKKERPEEKNQE